MQRILRLNYQLARRNESFLQLAVTTRTIFSNKNELLQQKSFREIRFFSSHEFSSHEQYPIRSESHSHQSYIPSDWDYNESFSSKMQRNAILLRGKMLEQRDLVIPIPQFVSKVFHSLQKKFKPRASTVPYSGLSFEMPLQSSRTGFSYGLYRFLNFFKINYQIVQDRQTQLKTLVLPYTLSNIAGHGSFLCLAFSYMESDFLHLRMYAFTGVTLAMLFQYYRERPLWIPIRWNGLFLLINLFMICALLKEENDADNLTDEEKVLYKTIFEKRGMKLVDFYHLISVSKRLEFKANDKLVDETKKNNRVYLVKKGKLQMSKNGMPVGKISENQFVGAMSFLTWEGALETSEAVHADARQQQQQQQVQPTHAKPSQQQQESAPPASTVPQPRRRFDYVGPITSMLLDIVSDAEDTLPSIPDLIDEKLQLTAGISASVGSEEGIVEKIETVSQQIADTITHLAQSSTETATGLISAAESATQAVNHELQEAASVDPTNNRYRVVNNAISLWYSTLSYIPYLGTSTPSGDNDKVDNSSPISAVALENVISVLSSESESSNTPQASDNKPVVHEEGHVGAADVICEEDCVVYSWRFKDLHNVISRNPKLGLIFERCISEDLNKKMTLSWEEEIKSRYKQILLGAIMDGEVNDVERQVLSKFRNEYHITADDHERILREFDWNLDDYDRGFKGGPSDATLEEYSTLLAKELENATGLSNEGRKLLREFRIANDINPDIHLNALKKLGWSFDDYEVGMKIDPVDAGSLRQALSPKSSRSKSSATSSSASSFSFPAIDPHAIGEVIKNRPVVSWLRGQIAAKKEQIVAKKNSMQSASIAPATLDEDDEFDWKGIDPTPNP